MSFCIPRFLLWERRLLAGGHVAAGKVIGRFSMDLWDPYGLALVMVVVAGSFLIMSLRKAYYRVRPIT